MVKRYEDNGKDNTLGGPVNGGRKYMGAKIWKVAAGT